MNKLKNHRGRFVTLTVNRARTGVQSYCAKIQKITDKTVTFWSRNDNKVMTIPTKNIVDA